MAYCGILDTLAEIDGHPVDFSRLEEGKIIAGDEVYDAEDFITEEDKLEFFNETAIRTKDMLVKDINSLLAEIAEESKVKPKHSEAFYRRYTELVRQFLKKVENSTFPEKLDDWWRYEYAVYESGITLTMIHIDHFDISKNDCISEIVDTVFNLPDTKSKLLTVEQYAEAYGVTVTTVRQWVRRGKIRSAIKMGSEWRIPELAEVTTRGYQPGHYKRKEYLTDLPKEYEFMNEYDYVDLEQNREHKELFDVCFSKNTDAPLISDEEWNEYIKTIQMSQKEREKFELYLIASPFVEASDTCLAYRNNI